MTDVYIGRIHATTSDADQPRVARLLLGVADRRLDAAVDALDLPGGHWCVRRLAVPVALDFGRSDAALEAAWADAIAGGLHAALLSGGGPAGPDADVLFYRHERDALVDLLGALALGRPAQAWAWRQLGLLAAGDPDPALAPTAAALAALRRRPAEAGSVLVRTIRSVGVPAVHRLLGGSGWTVLAGLVVTAHGGPATGFGPTFDATSQQPAAPASGADPDGPRRPTEGARALVDSVLARSELARAFTRSGIRPDAVTVAAWAALAVAEVEPARLTSALAPGVMAGVAARLAEVGASAVRIAGARAGAPAPEVKAGADRRAGVPESGLPATADGGPGYDDPGHDDPGHDDPGHAARPDPARTERVPVAVTPTSEDAVTHGPSADIGDGADVAPGTRWPTEWAGLIFFLATAAEAGLPGDLVDDEQLAGRPLAWLLYHLGRRLVPDIPAADPALFALAGLAPGEDFARPQPAEADRLDAHARRWAAVTAGRLNRADEDPFEVATQVAARPGAIVAEPGWLEVHLDVADVDLAVRRAGLDLDPGWVTWLGTVVVFVYE